MIKKLKEFVARNKESVMICGACVVVSFLVGMTSYWVENKRANIVAEKVALALEEHEKTFLDSVKYIETRSFVIMDTEMRILHHTIPHKHGIAGCPDCAKAFKEANERQTDRVLE